MTGGLSHLAGAAVVVTGVGGRGQAGEAVARRFAETGSVVHCVGRGDDARQRVDELTAAGLKARAHTVDLTDFEATARVALTIEAMHGGRIAAIAALAGGFGASGPVGASDTVVFTNQIAINLTTAYSTARAFASPVRSARGVFVFAASAAVLPGGKASGISGYAMAKGGLVQLVRAFAEEERESGMRVYAVAPTSIRTAANVAAMGENVKYVTLEDFAATILSVCHPSFALGSGEVIRLA